MFAQLLQFEGPDAGRFLQAQLATDLSRIDRGQWRWAALLSLKGRVTAHAPLARVEDQRWLWLLPADLHDSVASHLRRYLLRSKLTIEPSLATTRPIPVDAPAFSGQGSIEFLDDGMRLTAVVPGWSLELLTGTEATPGSHADDVIGSREAGLSMALARLHALLPLITTASSDRHLPQPLGLLELGSVSVKKGCYPGQEIVARTHYLGRSKRVACLIRAPLPAPITTANVLQGERNVGEVVEAQTDGERYLALAVVEEAALGAELTIEGRNAVPVASSSSQ